MGRCGVEPGEGLVELCSRVRELPGLKFRGLMTYQGYITGTPADRESEMRDEGDRVGEILAQLEGAGIACEVVSGGTSPSLYYSHTAPAINENRCGTYVFNDRNMVASRAVGWDSCAMKIAVTVVSTAVPGQIIIDGGSKTFSGDRCSPWEGYGRIGEDPDLLFLKMNEEHGYVRSNGTRKEHVIGERLHIVPNHVCTAMNMHDQVWAHRGGEIEACWQVAARGRIR